MSIFKPGLVHTPVTPFKQDYSIDFDIYAQLIEFHLRNGAEAIALPVPEGEDISLKDEEQSDVLEFAIKRVDGRVPVIAHVSDAGTQLAVARAKHAEKMGAAAIVSHPPYFWHPKPEMVLEHLVQIGKAVQLPFFAYTPPVETAGTTLTTEIVLTLIERLDNLAGIVDAGMRWVFMIEVISNGRQLNSEFQLISGTDYMVSPCLIGGSGVFSALSLIGPKLVRQVYDLCRKEQYIEARQGQEQIATLRKLLKNPRFEVGLKAALSVMERDCGKPRPPAAAMEAIEYEKLEKAMADMPFLQGEPRGWD